MCSHSYLNPIRSCLFAYIVYFHFSSHDLLVALNPFNNNTIKKILNSVMNCCLHIRTRKLSTNITTPKVTGFLYTHRTFSFILYTFIFSFLLQLFLVILLLIISMMTRTLGSHKGLVQESWLMCNIDLVNLFLLYLSLLEP